MRRRLPRLSGREVIEILINKFGFTARRQRGSHVVLVKHTEDTRVMVAVSSHLS